MHRYLFNITNVSYKNEKKIHFIRRKTEHVLRIALKYTYVSSVSKNIQKNLSFMPSGKLQLLLPTCLITAHRSKRTPRAQSRIVMFHKLYKKCLLRWRKYLTRCQMTICISWRVRSSGLEQRVFLWKSTNVSGEHVASIFRAERYVK
jgi:hypothetical protein